MSGETRPSTSTFSVEWARIGVPTVSNTRWAQKPRPPYIVTIMKSQLPTLLLICLLAWTGLTSAQSTGPSAELERNQIAEGETVTLNLTLPGELDGEPDFSPLEKDFDILGRSQSSHTNIINGRMDSKRVWRLTLAPKRDGLLTVPPIPVGGMRSPALALKVVQAGDPASGGQAPQAFIEVQADPETPYVQGQVIYTVRVFHRVNLRDGGLSDPAADGMPVERLGEDRNYKEYRHGHRYSVIERRYALFPQHSGRLEIQPPVLSANVLVQSRRTNGGLAQRIFGHDPFGNMGSVFQESRPLRVRGKQLNLEVRPQPADATGSWLPARSVTLEESWSPQNGFRVGEPITRSITLRARGLTDSQLPDLQAPTVEGLKVYADRPQGETGPAGSGLEAVKQFKAALVPTREGSFELPETRIEWWDTSADLPRVAVLPGRSIQVLPALVSEAPPAPKQPLEQPVADGRAVAEELPESLPPPISTAVHPNHWPWIAAGLALAWLITLLFWLRERRLRTAGRSGEKKTESRPPKPDTASVKLACRAQDPARARQALLDWARATWPERPPAGLSELSARLGNTDAAAALRELDATLYAFGEGVWDGGEAWKRLGGALKQPVSEPSSTHRGPLPPLYPQTST